MQRKPLSERQQQILDFIEEYHLKHGYSPNIREICAAVYLGSSSTVHMHLVRMEQKGYIRRARCKPRSIEVIDMAKRRGQLIELAQAAEERLRQLGEEELATKLAAALAEIPTEQPEEEKEAA